MNPSPPPSYPTPKPLRIEIPPSTIPPRSSTTSTHLQHTQKAPSPPRTHRQQRRSTIHAHPPTPPTSTQPQQQPHQDLPSKVQSLQQSIVSLQQIVVQLLHQQHIMSTEITRLQLSQPNQMTEPRVLVNGPAPPPPPSVPYSMDMLPISGLNAAGFISGMGVHQPQTSQHQSSGSSGVVGDQDLFSAFFVNNSGHTSSC